MLKLLVVGPPRFELGSLAFLRDATQSQ